MKMKSMMLLAVASGCGLLAMFLFQQAQGSPPQQEKKVQVLYCILEATPGTQLDDTNVEFREIPISAAPETAVTIPEDYAERATRVRLFPGDVVTIDKLGKKGEKGASGDIPEGFVAVPIPVDATMMLGGLLLPGDRVDVLVTYRSTNQLGKRIMTVLEFVEVFATDAKRDIDNTNSENDTETITLLVTQKEALLVKLAEDVGKLHLTLRSKDDKNPKLVTEDQKFKENHHVNFFNQDDDDDDDKQSQRERQRREADQAAAARAAAARAIDAASTKAEVQPEPEPEPVPTWKVEIFAGDNKQVEEFVLPVVKKPAQQNPLLNTLNSTFGGTKKAETEATNEPQLPLLPPVAEDDADDDDTNYDAETDRDSSGPTTTGADDSEPPIPFPVDR